MIWAIAFALLLTIAFFIVDSILKAPVYKGPRAEHFNGNRFINLDKFRARGLKDIIKWSMTGERGEWQELTDRDINFHKPPGATKEGDVAITFINHSTFLIQVDGVNILTDPIWSNRASPFQWIGPKRKRPPGIRFDDLPEIHLVLLSHNHYDHLDITTVKKLSRCFQPLFITPLGVSRYLNICGISNTVELDWWEEYHVNDALKLSGVPAQHFSGRGVTDRDKTLWCGYMLEATSGTIYFAGDSGYDGFFKKIGQKFGPIDLSLIPIGAYRPRWFMSPIHVDPEQAVFIHKEVRSRTSIGMHFGTFPLADEGMHEPVNDLEKAKKKHGIAPEVFITLQEGETRTFMFSRAAKTSRIS